MRAPEDIAKEFIDSISDGWGEEVERQDTEALTIVLKKAINDKLEEVASMFVSVIGDHETRRIIRSQKIT